MLERITKQKVKSKSFRFTPPHFKLLIISWLVIMGLGSAKAQKPANFDSLSYEKQMRIIFSRVKMDSLKTGRLYNIIAPMSGADSITGTDKDTVSVESLIQFASELNRCKVSPFASATDTALAVFKSAADYFSESNKIPIGLIHSKIDLIKPNVLTDSVWGVDSDSLIITKDSTRSPFTQSDVMMVAFLTNKPFEPKPYTFWFEPKLVFSTIGAVAESIAITFNNTTTTLLPGDSVTLDFAGNIGKGPIKFNVILKAPPGSEFSPPPRPPVDPNPGPPPFTPSIRFVQIVMNRYNEFDNEYGAPPCTRSLVIEGYRFNASAYGGDNTFGVAEVSFYFGNDQSGLQEPNCLRTRVKKPIIILDGFDPLDARKASKIYKENLQYKVTSPGFRTIRFADNLRMLGYDIVIVNYPNYSTGDEIITNYLNNNRFPPTRTAIPDAYKGDNGGGYIERNGLSTVKVIQYLNQELRQQNINEQLVIMGPSMGGLISQYALAYMEKQQTLMNNDLEREFWNHNTRLWVSFDAPHLGANIPIALQATTRFFADTQNKEAAKKGWRDRINSIAARQLLLHHLNAGGPTPNPDNFRNIFMQNLTNNGLPGSDGYPVNLRRIGISDGDLKGGKFTDGNYGMPNLDAGCALVSGFAGIRLIDGTNLETYSVPDNGRSNVRVFYAFRSGFLTFFNRTQRTLNASAFDNTVSLDLAEGGLFETAKIISEGIYGGEASGDVASISVANIDIPGTVSHCFIPVKSALAIKAGITPLSEDLTTRNLVCTGETYFDAYYAPTDRSYVHTEINHGIDNFVTNEILGNITSHPIVPVTIQGPSVFCNSGSYNGFRAPLGLTEFLSRQFDFNWTLPNGLNSSNTTTYNLAVNTSSFGFGKLDFQQTKLDRQNRPCIWQGSKSISFGVPSVDQKPIITPSSVTRICVNNVKRFYCDPFLGTSNTPSAISDLVGDTHLNEYQWISSHPNSLILIGTGFDRTLGKYYADFQAANSNGTGVGNFSVACSVVTNCFTAVSLPSTVRVNPNCFPISTIVTPSSGAVNSTAMVRGFVANENGPIGGGRVTISDSRKHQLDETISDPNGYFVFNIEALELKAALYTIEVKTDDGAENTLIWALMPNENGNLIASPNPAIPEIDQQINCQIIGLSDTLSPYNITFLDPSGEAIKELEAPFPSFKLDVEGLDPGNYTILATDKTGVTWVNQVSLVLDGSPTLQIDANPVSNNLSGKILKPIAGLIKLSIRLVSITGDVVFEDSDLPASGFNINVANIPNGTYTFTAFDGYRMHTQHIVILH